MQLIHQGQGLVEVMGKITCQGGLVAQGGIVAVVINQFEEYLFSFFNTVLPLAVQQDIGKQLLCHQGIRFVFQCLAYHLLVITSVFQFVEILDLGHTSFERWNIRPLHFP